MQINILPKINSNTLSYYFYCCCHFRYWKKFKALELDINLQIRLSNLMGFWIIEQIAQSPAQMGTCPSAQWVLENYILLPKGDSQKLQHNFLRFLKLFSNFVNPIATHTADRSIVLAQKHPNFTLKVCSNGPLVLPKVDPINYGC